MKKSYLKIGMIAALVVFASCSSESTEPATPNAEEEPTVELTKEIETRAIEQANNFSYNLFAAVNDDLSNLNEKNVFISPLSVSMELSMVANGAVGNTRDEIIKALGYDDVTTIDGINQVNAKLLATLPSVDEKVKLSIANALWVSNGSAIKTAFSDKLKESYLASVDNLDFSADNSVNVINNWANVNTNGLIPKVVDFIDPLTKIFLANALYFKGDWGVGEFMGNLTMNFTDYEGKTSKVDAMEKSNDILYNSNDKCAITTLPIGNGSYTYTAVLPNDNVSVSDAVASLTDDFLNGVTSQYVSYKSPKFDIENELTLNSYLRALGIKSMFDDSADFSNMTDNKEIFLNCVMHNTNISVSEQGLEAAAVTDEIWASWCPDDGSGTTVKIKEFFLNKPFAFIIRETSTNAIVFIGAVNKL